MLWELATANVLVAFLLLSNFAGMRTGITVIDHFVVFRLLLPVFFCSFSTGDCANDACTARIFNGK